MTDSIVPDISKDYDVYARPLEWLVAGTNQRQNFFVTGRAGCGKTTLIKRFREQSGGKNIVVLAPTALTAINSGGQTIHSFFRFRPSLFRQKYYRSKFAKLDRNKRRLIRSLDVLIIDEISMVRSDVFDAIDKRLKSVRLNNLPFGGVQIILVGDLRQIAPVVTGTQHKPRISSKDKKVESNTLVMQIDRHEVKSKQPLRLVNDDGTLGINFKGTYFFNTDAFQLGNFYFISLQHVFRQTEPAFLTILDGIRRGDIERSMKTDSSIRRILEGLVSTQNHEEIAEDCTVLTPTNDIAQRINRYQFDKIDSDVVRMKARFDLGFIKHLSLWFGSAKQRFKTYRNLSTSKFIADRVLLLKVGAKVVFLQNDPEKRWINGTRGIIEKIADSSVFVRNDETEELMEVKRTTWKEYGYRYSWLKRKSEKYVKLQFQQFPIRLAYAVTIHKSQGLTLDKVFIEFGRGMFAHGQAYVAFSRARTLKGLQISRLPTNKDLKLDRDAIPPQETFEFIENKKNCYSIGRFKFTDINSYSKEKVSVIPV